MNWARRLQSGGDLAAAELAVRDGSTTWDASPYLASESRSQELADLLGNLQGEPAEVLRRSFAQIFAAFFPEDAAPERSTRPIANMLFLLLALDDTLSAADLVLLEQLLTRLLGLGLSEADYVSLVGDLAEVQGRIASYAYLAWSLDVCEALAVAPSPSTASREARLRFFLSVLGQAQGFGHRLLAPDLLVIEYLAKDFGVDAEAITSLRRASEAVDADSTAPDLSGKTIGIYTSGGGRRASRQATARDALPRLRRSAEFGPCLHLGPDQSRAGVGRLRVRMEEQQPPSVLLREGGADEVRADLCGRQRYGQHHRRGRARLSSDLS